MAHYKRHRCRLHGAGHYSSNALDRRLDGKVAKGDRKHWTGSYPRWWDKVFHIRPTRAATRMVEISVMKGEDPEQLVWPHPKKPHSYYW